MTENPPYAHVVDAAPIAGDREFVSAAHLLFAALVRDGAALGWIDPPEREEIGTLLGTVAAGAARGDAALRAAFLPAAAPPAGPAGSPARELVGIGYWVRYDRPTHWPHANIRRVAVAASAQGRGIGRALTRGLIDAARQAGIEVLTLDARGDNASALHLYRTLGFEEYGRLKNFVAVGERRYDTVLCALDLREFAHVRL